MIAIRGATTVDFDNAEQIREATNEMLGEIKRRNNLEFDDFICLLFSTTDDIKSVYPAKCARESGFTSCALYSSLEPDINGSLKKCIRVLALCEKEIPKKQIKNVYLKGAVNLRKDLTVYNIALDGEAGSGKSTVAKILAKELDILYLDTGAMYRACALKAKKIGINSLDEKGVSGFIDDIDLQIRYEGGSQKTYLDGENVSEEIRKPDISMLASNISSLKCVRYKMVDMQRKIASETSCVLDGRDIGSFVLPNAKYKFYVTASLDVRTKRRFNELKEKGFDVDFDKLKTEISQRDENDKNREFAPLRKAKDAIVVDTSNMTVDEVLQTIKSYIDR